MLKPTETNETQQQRKSLPYQTILKSDEPYSAFKKYAL